MDKRKGSPISISNAKIPNNHCTGIDEFVEQTNDDIKLPIELTNVTGTHFHDMKEDNLLEIFSLKLLNLMDLCSLAETCKRFLLITQRIAQKKLCIRQLESGDCEMEYGIYRFREQSDYERIFKNFGSILADVWIEARYNADKKLSILDLVTRHCGNALECLKISTLNDPDVITIGLKPVFKRLKKLHLSYVNMMGDAMLFADLDSLIELIVIRVNNCGAILGNIFPKLERFTFEKRDIVMTDSINDPVNEQTFLTFLTFISRHKTLNSIDLYFSCDESCKVIVLQTIGNSCKDLKELFIDIGGRTNVSLQPLQTLKSLSTIKIWCMMFEDFKVFSNLSALRELSLLICILPKESFHFSSLVHLTKLELCNWHSPDVLDVLDVVGIISQLLNLRELIIFHRWKPFVLDEKTFSEIVGVVKGRPNLLTLICAINFEVEENWDEGQMIKLLPSPTTYITTYC